MPVCKRDGFESSQLKNRDDTFHDNDDVFYCEVTKEIFRDYEDYFRHVMIINSTVWQCEETGHEGLTFAEALKSEKRARKRMNQFKEALKAPILLVIESARQSSIKALNAIVIKFVRRRYFIGEEVTACSTSTKYHNYTVVEVLPPDGAAVPGNGVYEETETLQYKLRRTDRDDAIITVPFENIRRSRYEVTIDNIQMYVKGNVMRVDGILHPKPEPYKKYVTDQKITLAKIFIGQMPRFTPAKLKRPANDQASKKQSTLNKYLTKNGVEGSKAKAGHDASKKPSIEELQRIEKEKQERAQAKAAAKAQSLKEQMDRVRQEKAEKMLALERERAEKRAKLLERVDAECTALLVRTDDLERNDQRLLPIYKPIQTHIPTALLGDAFTIREFMHSFSALLSGNQVFRNGINFFEISRAFTMREVAGPLSDILLVLLGTIFDLQKEEEEECAVKYLLLRKEVRKREPYITMSQATRAHFYCHRHFNFKLNELPIDAQTLSEVLRLHLLSSGAIVAEKAEKWRMMYRNGYTSSEDPGLSLRMQHPHILRELKMKTVFQLPMIDIIHILRCLIYQILTYSSPINTLEERHEEMVEARVNVKALGLVENRRLASVQTQRRALNNEYALKCLDDDVKNDEEKKRILTSKLDRKITELMVQSDREHHKYEEQIRKERATLFNFLVALGMDRAYRKYYVLESMPGIFIEHPQDCMDTCLTEPPINDAECLKRANLPDLPRNRKDMRNYLVRLYTDEDKKKTNKEKKSDSSTSQENKENQENGLVINGLPKVHDAASALLVNGSNSGSEKAEGEESERNIEEKLPPTQYQLYMCTGDPSNCIVHDPENKDRQRWAYIYEKQDIDTLIESLNLMGERESHLREQLTTLRDLIINHVESCPSELLSLDNTQRATKFKQHMLAETHRKYNNSNFGFETDVSDLNEVMYAALVERILKFESDIYTGDLGRLRVKDMVKWREDIVNNTYDGQEKLQWGPNIQKLANGGIDDEEEDVEDVTGNLEDDAKDGGHFANKKFTDPGSELCENDCISNMNIDGEAEDDSLLRTNVHNLSCALLQVEQAIERRFIKEPFGAPTIVKDKELHERRLKAAANRLKQWEVSLMESNSYSQIFLHLNILHDSILWSRSTNKSMCQICRRGTDPEKMLLCDVCNGGTHMFCMKPKMKSVPEGNWYCSRCVNLGHKNELQPKVKKPRRKRKFNVEEDEPVEAADDTVEYADDNDNASHASSLSASSTKVTAKNSNSSGRGRGRAKKRMESSEIAAALEDDDEKEEAEDDEILEDNDEAEEALEGDADETAVNSNDEEEQEANNSENDSDADDDEVCVVCSYDGADIHCSQCKDIFHLECVNLKRAPRYNFHCQKCKKKDEKRKSRTNDNDTEDDDTESSEPAVKRARQSRSTLRHSLPNGIAAGSRDASNQRRSNRRTGEHLPLNSAALYELLGDVLKHADAWPFLRPVMQSEVPDYYKVIENPMDLARVKSKLNMGKYQLNEEVMKDLQLIFHNCDRYNVEGNEVYLAGCSLEKYVMRRCKQLQLPFLPSDMNTN